MTPTNLTARMATAEPVVVAPIARELRGAGGVSTESVLPETRPVTVGLRLVEWRPMVEHGTAQPSRRPRIGGFTPSRLDAVVSQADRVAPNRANNPRGATADNPRDGHTTETGARLGAESCLGVGPFSERAQACGTGLTTSRTGTEPCIAESAECGLTCAERVGELYKSFYHRVFCFARRSVSDEEAEEVAHETFVRLLRVRNLERMSISVAYLLRIADNLLKRKHERAQRYRVVLERSSMVVLGGEEACEPGSDRGQGACGAVVEQFDTDRIHAAMRRLTSEEQTAIRLIVCEGLDYQAAARSMGVRVSTINNWKHRGLAKLKQLVGINRSASDAATAAVG